MQAEICVLPLSIRCCHKGPLLNFQQKALCYLNEPGDTVERHYLGAEGNRVRWRTGTSYHIAPLIAREGCLLCRRKPCNYCGAALFCEGEEATVERVHERRISPYIFSTEKGGAVLRGGLTFIVLRFTLPRVHEHHRK